MNYEYDPKLTKPASDEYQQINNAEQLSLLSSVIAIGEQALVDKTSRIEARPTGDTTTELRQNARNCRQAIGSIALNHHLDSTKVF